MNRPTLRRTLLVLALVAAPSPSTRAEAMATPALLFDFYPGEFPDAPPVADLRRIGDRLFFVAGDRETAPQLWISQGSAATTRRVTAPGLSPADSASLVAGLDGRAVWRSTTATNVHALWATDAGGHSELLKGSGVRPASNGALAEPTVRGRYYFAACEPSCSLWSTDGSASGTHVEAIGGDLGANPPFIAALDARRLVFLSTRGVSVLDVVSGQVDLALPVAPSLVSLYATEGNLYVRITEWTAPPAARHELWFLPAGGRHAHRFYRSDGPLDVEGWRGGRLYFADRGADSTWDYTPLWSSDGTRQGTQRLRGDLVPSSFSYLASQLGSAGSHGLLSAYSYSYKWHSDGGGLYRIDDDQGRVERLSACWGDGPHIDYRGSAFGSCGGRLFHSDGGELEFTPRLEGVRGDRIREIDGRLVLGAKTRQGTPQLWESDGTSAGTRPLSGRARDTPFEISGAPVGLDGAIFVPAKRLPVGQQLFRVEAGTATPLTALAHLGKGIEADWAGDLDGVPVVVAAFELQSIRSGSAKRLPGDVNCSSYSCDVTPLVLPNEAGSTLLYQGGSVYLARTDGTEEGTRILHLATSDPACRESLDETGQLEVQGLTRLGDRALVLDGGGALWSSDGTEAGTACVTRIQPEAGSWLGWGSNPVFSPAAAGDGVFVTFTVESGPGREPTSEIWHTDATAAGTWFVTSFVKDWNSAPNPVLTSTGGLSYFIGAGHVQVTDGSPAGSHPLLGGPSDAPAALRASGGRLFAVFSGAAASSLWVHDPAVGSWSQLPAKGWVDLEATREAGGALFFFASRDPATNPATGSATWPLQLTLWRSDGSVEGTTPVDGIPPTDFAGKGLASLGDRVVLRACDEAAGCELWSVAADGTNPRRETDLWRGPRSSDPYFIGESDRALYFSAIDPDIGREVWSIAKGPR